MPIAAWGCAKHCVRNAGWPSHGGVAESGFCQAMKCISARFDSHDLEDTRFLIGYLRLQTPREVFDIIHACYPQRLVPPKAQFLIEELLPEQALRPPAGGVLAGGNG